MIAADDQSGALYQLQKLFLGSPRRCNGLHRCERRETRPCSPNTELHENESEFLDGIKHPRPSLLGHKHRHLMVSRCNLHPKRLVLHILAMIRRENLTYPSSPACMETWENLWDFRSAGKSRQLVSHCFPNLSKLQYSELARRCRLQEAGL